MSSSNTPHVGDPFIPWRKFQGAFVPEPLLKCNLLSKGAKLCYAQLSRHAGEDGRCFPRQSVLAAELGLTPKNGDRQVRRYILELESCSQCQQHQKACKCERSLAFIQSRQHGLNEPNSYVFLWHPIFENAKPLIHKDRTFLSAPDRTYVSAQDRTFPSGPYKEEESPLRESGLNPSIPTLPSDQPVAMDRLKALPRKQTCRTNWGWPAEDMDFLRQQIATFETQAGEPLTPTDQLMTAVMRKATFYMATPYQLLAILYRVHTRIQRRPATWPESQELAARWLPRVIENEFADGWLERMPPGRVVAVLSEQAIAVNAPTAPSPDPNDLQERQDFIQQLAAKKAFPVRRR